jgi:iron complex outermembrane receptor protein
MKIASLSAQCVAGTVLLVGVSPIAAAEQTAETENTAETAQNNSTTDSSVLNEIVVTAQKRTQRLQDVPVTITALSTADLDRAGVATMSDLPSVVSGLIWSNQGTWVEPNLRGVYTTVAAVGSASPIAIYVDGIYQPSQSGTLVDLPDVSHVEVLKGPQGTLFGRNATGGAISISTLDPSFTSTGNVEISAGAYGGGSSDTSGHYGFRGFVSGPVIDDVLAAGLSAEYNHTDGYMINDVNGQRYGEINSELVRGKLLWKLSDNANFLATAYYGHREDAPTEAGYPQYGVTAAAAYPDAIVPTRPWHVTWNGNAPQVTDDSKGVSIKGTFQLDAGTITTLSGYSQVDPRVFSSVHAAYSPACVAAFACIDAFVASPLQAYSQEVDFASRKFGPVSFVAGLFGFYDKATEHDAYNGVFSDDTVTWTKSYAAFAESTYEVTSDLSAIVGARVTHDSLDANGSYYGKPLVNYAHKGWTSGTPRASLVYKIDPTLNAYVTYSGGFKGGVVSGQYTTAPPADPEKISAFEVGLKAAAEKYSFNVSAFYYNYRDLQVEFFSNLVTTPQNAAKAKIYGLDADGTVILTDTFRIRVNGTWLPTAEYTSFPQAIAFLPPLGPFGLVTHNNFDATGARMLVTPVLTGTLSGTYGKAYGWGRFEATASVYHSGEYHWDYPGTMKTDQYDLLNGELTFAPAGTHMKYTAYGKNLTNKAYIQGGLPTATAHEVYYAPPREVGLRAAYSF